MRGRVEVALRSRRDRVGPAPVPGLDRRRDRDVDERPARDPAAFNRLVYSRPADSLAASATVRGEDGMPFEAIYARRATERDYRRLDLGGPGLSFTGLVACSMAPGIVCNRRIQRVRMPGAFDLGDGQGADASVPGRAGRPPRRSGGLDLRCRLEAARSVIEPFPSLGPHRPLCTVRHRPAGDHAPVEPIPLRGPAAPSE